MDKKYKYLYVVSVLMLLSGAALALTDHVIFDLIYALGAVGYLLYFLLAPEREASSALKRYARMGVFSGFLFVLSAAARFGLFDSFGANLWVFALLLALLYMIYGTVLLYRLPKE